MELPSAAALRVFDAAARLGSFKAAAEEMRVSPTAVSHQIRRLEEQLGLALFVRRTRKVELTEAGARLAKATSAAFGLIADALGDISAAEQTLTISTTPAFAALWLVPRVRDFEAAHPGLRVHVDSALGLVDLARDRRIDIAIRYGRPDYPGLAAELLARESVAAFGAPSYLATMGSLAEATLIDTRWYLPSLESITWDDWFATAGEAPARNDRRSFEDEQHVISAGLAGQGLILVSTVLVEDLVSRGWLAPYRPEVALPGFCYTCLALERSLDTQKVRRFLRWLRRTKGPASGRSNEAQDVAGF